MENEMTEIQFVKSKFTGGHYGFVATRSGKVFTNNLREITSVPLSADDIVADVGAFVGEYSMWAARQGVKKVLSYEASPETFQVLQKNRVDPMVVTNKAVVGTDVVEIELFLSSGIGATNSITKKNKKDDSVIVPAINYRDAVAEATVVKIDVEGAEYSYDIVQPNLRAILLEFHPIVGRDWVADAKRIMENIQDNGFLALKTPGFTHGFDVQFCARKE
jgi:FkbM family methyltransferase